MNNDPLFQPFSAGKLTLRNRICMAPMSRGFAPGGVLADFMAAYYERRAAADVGLIVTEGIIVDHPAALGNTSIDSTELPTLHSPGALARWTDVVQRVQAHGTRIFPQLWHQGGVRLDGTGPHPDAPSCRPSGIWGPAHSSPFFPADYLLRARPATRPMTDTEIADVIAGFARSAALAARAGFDGIALHGGHGYLIDAFFWDKTNQRRDRWGGPALRERAAFGVELVRAVRAASGNLPLLLRFSQWKIQQYEAQLARTPAELEQLLGPLADAGVDMFDASTRRFADPAFAGSTRTLAGWTRHLTGKPTIAVGGIGLAKDLQSSFDNGSDALNNLDQVRDLIRCGEFDLMAVGRALLADPCWAQKARRGEPFLRYDLAAATTQV